MNEAKSIFEYDNYRDFLKERYLIEKARDKKFSFRYFARICGFTSSGFLKLVMDGKANLSTVSAEKVVQALKLNKEESSFFKDLVRFAQATKTEEKNIFAQKIMSSHKYRKIHPIQEAQYNYLSNWYYVPVRELVGLSYFQDDPNWIASQINPPITANEAKKAISELLTLDLIKRGGDGKLSLTNANINTVDEVVSCFAADFHTEMMKRASESITRIPRQNREISSLTMGVSEETAKIVKEKIQKFRQELVNVVSQDQGINAVYQLNFQFFPVTKLPGTKLTGTKLSKPEPGSEK